MLTDEQVMKIYMLKISMLNELLTVSRAANLVKRMRGRSHLVGLQYGVSARTIRDIWNRKTWAYASQRLWTLESSVSDGAMIHKNSPQVSHLHSI